MSEAEKKLEMTPEKEAMLKRYRGYSPKTLLKWSPPWFRENLPRTEWPLFKYRTRGALDVARDEDDLQFISIAGVTHSNASERIFNITRRCTETFKNVKDKDGKEIACEKDENGITEECWNKISMNLLKEYVEAIKEESSLTEEEIRGLEF